MHADSIIFYFQINLFNCFVIYNLLFKSALYTENVFIYGLCCLK